MGGEEEKTGRIIIEEKTRQERRVSGECLLFRTKDQVFSLQRLTTFLDTEEEDRAAWVKHWKGLSS